MTNRLRKQQTGFTQVPNALLHDPCLSLKAKGLYGLLFSKPDEWVYIEDVLVRESADGRDSFRSGIAELVTAGWLVKRQIQDKNGKFSHTDWVLTVDGKSVDGFPVAGKPDANNTDRSNTDKQTPCMSPTEGFDVWWEKYGRKGSRRQAEDQWKRLKLTSIAEQVMAGTDHYLASRRVRNGYKQDGFRWLRDRGWEADWDGASVTRPETPMSEVPF